MLNRLNVDHDLSKKARAALSLEFLSRAAQSIEALDPEAAGIWIDEAEGLLGATDEGVRKARSALTEQLIAMESAKPVPASALKIATYVAPVFPQRANERSLEGWVDIEFTVGTDGRTRNVVVTDASHEILFRSEATDAVEQVAIRAARVHGPRDRAKLLHAYSLRPVAACAAAAPASCTFASATLRRTARRRAIRHNACATTAASTSLRLRSR